MSVYKNFDQNNYDKNDQLTRDAVLRYLRGEGHYVIENPDKYGPDLILYSGYKPVAYIEVERKLVWRGANFPYPTVNLPERKAKFLKTKLPIDFWILNHDLNCAMIIPDLAVELKFLNEVANSSIASGEMFYQIPLELCNYVELTQGSVANE